jgi:hypothetical protein
MIHIATTKKAALRNFFGKTAVTIPVDRGVQVLCYLHPKKLHAHLYVHDPFGKSHEYFGPDCILPLNYKSLGVRLHQKQRYM